MGEDGESNIVSVGTQSNGSCLGHGEEGDQVRRRDPISADPQIKKGSYGHNEELLPGIPDQVFLALIIPKLPWTASHILSSVSRCWREAIQARKIYDARVRANSIETLVVHIHSHGQTRALALYSLRDKCCHELPPIPYLDNLIPHSCQCLALDGKLYVLGGEHLDWEYGMHGTAEVFVLDLAGQRKWRRCASMQEPRQDFGCGVFEGKIFVFGGSSNNQRVLGSEVYDPEQNVWSSRMPMPSWRCDHRVGTVGNELFVYGGRFTNWDSPLFRSAFLLDIYHPAKNEWRLLEPFGKTGRPLGNLAMAKGKLCWMMGSQIEVYDTEKNSWTKQHTISFPRVGPIEPLKITPTATFAVDDEVVVAAHWYNTDTDHGTYLFQSKGFASEMTQLEWQTISCPLPTTICLCQMSSNGFMCTIQL